MITFSHFHGVLKKFVRENLYNWDLAVVLYLFCKNILHALEGVQRTKLARGLESVTSDRESGRQTSGSSSAGGNDLGSQFFIIILGPSSSALKNIPLTHTLQNVGHSGVIYQRDATITIHEYLVSYPNLGKGQLFEEAGCQAMMVSTSSWRWNDLPASTPLIHIII